MIWSVPCALTGGLRCYERVAKGNATASRRESLPAPSSAVASSSRGVNPSLPTYEELEWVFDARNPYGY